MARTKQSSAGGAADGDMGGMLAPSGSAGSQVQAACRARQTAAGRWCLQPLAAVEGTGSCALLWELDYQLAVICHALLFHMC